MRRLASNEAAQNLTAVDPATGPAAWTQYLRV